MTARRWTRAAHETVRALLDRCLDAYAETAWVYRYGPGFAPTAPVRFADAPRPAARAYRVQTLGTPRPAPRQPSGFRAPGRGLRPGRRAPQTPASRSAAHASASA